MYRVLSWLKCVGRALRKRPTRIILTVVLMVLLHFLPVTGWLRFGLYLKMCIRDRFRHADASVRIRIQQNGL